MIKFIGIFLMFLCFWSLERGFSFSAILWFLIGLFLVFSQGIFSHLMFVEREKVKTQYRRKR